MKKRSSIAVGLGIGVGALLMAFAFSMVVSCEAPTSATQGLDLSKAARGEWAPYVAYVVGDTVTYQGTTYTCRQSHTSLPGWEPPNVLALWLPGGSGPTPTPTPTSVTPTPTPTGATPTPTPTAVGGWNMVWSDEFNGSGQPNPANWNYDVGNGYNPGLPGFQGWGNSEWEWYRPENCYQQGGNLVIRADYSSTPLYNVGGRNWYQTSGRMTSHGKQSWQYGRIEARVQLPTAAGNWCAFWMMGDSENGTYTSNYHPAASYYDTMASDWASCGEVDIMEHVNGGNIGINNIFWDTRTGVFPWTAGMNANYGNTNVNYGNVAQFHVYAIEWDATYIKWFVDGVQTHIIDITPATLEEFHKPFYLIFNMAIAGTLPGVTPNIADFPLYMYVDYVRVYKKA